jgi:multimeric flavodoxin WrbA
MMKVVAFNGSPHYDGVIAKGISIIQRELEKSATVSVNTIQVGDRHIRGCIDCRQCGETHRCIIEDGVVNEALDLLSAADGIILGSPVYYGGIAGTFKSFLDRIFCAGPNMPFKVGATVVSLRRSGGIATFNQLNSYFNLAGVIIAPSISWDIMYGNNARETQEDKEGLQIVEIQGRNMAWLLKIMAAAKEDIPLPPHVTERKKTNFIH